MKKGNQSVADAVLCSLPRETKTALSVISQLNLPLHDKCSFDDQLSQISQKADESTRREISNLQNGFTVRDFPILSLNNAVEKYWTLNRPFPFPQPRPIWPEFNVPGDFRERPSISRIFQDTFDDPAAAACATKAYAEAIRLGLTEFQAIIIGMQAGNRYRETGNCD